MINISHVKKYEQVNLCSRNGKGSIKPFFLACFILTISISYAIPIMSLQKVWAKTNEVQAQELPLEISEKYYKKDAILKFNDAVKKWEEKSVPEAIALFNEAIQLDPNLWIAYLGLGQAYDHIKEYTKSLNAYKEYLRLAPKQAQDRKTVTDAVQYLSHLLKNGEEIIKSEDYLSIVKTKHQGKELYVRWSLINPIKIYFYPANGIPNYKSEFQSAFLEGAMIWQEVLPDLKLEVIDNSILSTLKPKEKEKREKELIESVQIKVLFPSRFKIKGDPSNPIASQIDAQSFPIIRDKKNFRVLGVIMISPFIYHQAQIAIPLEPLSKLKDEEQIKKLKITAAREIGHVLGLWGFSPNPDDLMFEGEVTELKLSNRDKNTIKKLYELDPTSDERVLTNL